MTAAVTDCDVLPAASTAVKVTRVSPRANTEGASSLTATAPSVSSSAEADAKNATIALSVIYASDASPAKTTMSAGGVTTGAVVSTTSISDTVTVAVTETAVLPTLSTALKLTPVTPIGNTTGALLVTVTD